MSTFMCDDEVRRLADTLARAVGAHRCHIVVVATRLQGEDGAAHVDQGLRRLEPVGVR